MHDSIARRLLASPLGSTLYADPVLKLFSPELELLCLSQTPLLLSIMVLVDAFGKAAP